MPARGAVSPRPRLVVLPFINLSDDSSQEYFSVGLTEELIAQLGPLCRGEVGIIARSSSMFYKGSLRRARERSATGFPCRPTSHVVWPARS